MYTDSVAARLTNVAVTDYRSIESCSVHLQPLMFLVGPNGSGKSNFLDALRFLVNSMHAPIEQVIDARYGLKSVLRKLPNGEMAASFSTSVEFELEDGRAGFYLLTISEDENGGCLIDSERCDVGGEHFFVTRGTLVETSVPTPPAFTGDRPALVSFGALPQFAPVFKLIAGLTFYAPNPDRMRAPKVVGPGKVLSFDASNSADVVARIESTLPDVIERISGYLRSFNPEFDGLTVTEFNNYRWLAFRPATHPGSWKFNAWNVSDGTLRAVAILLAIFQATTISPPLTLIGLVEPEIYTQRLWESFWTRFLRRVVRSRLLRLPILPTFWTARICRKTRSWRWPYMTGKPSSAPLTTEANPFYGSGCTLRENY